MVAQIATTDEVRRLAGQGVGLRYERCSARSSRPTYTPAVMPPSITSSAPVM